MKMKTPNYLSFPFILLTECVNLLAKNINNENKILFLPLAIQY